MPRPGHRATPWRSKSEAKTGAILKERGVPFGFETLRLSYLLPATKHHYTPDFVLENGVIIEVKGLWTAQDRQKIIQVRKQNPGVDLRILFDRPTSPIYKGSPTTYADFCDRNGIPWAKGPTPPDDWLQPQKVI